MYPCAWKVKPFFKKKTKSFLIKVFALYHTYGAFLYYLSLLASILWTFVPGGSYSTNTCNVIFC